MEAPGADDFLYNQIVSRLAFQIQTQVLKPGDKLPSVRALSQEQHISVSTAFKAYSELENKGLVEARPRSGFYVRGALKRPAFSRPAPSPAGTGEPPSPAVDFPQVLREVYGTLSDPHLIKLSLSAPTPNLIPVARLNKALGHVLRESASGCAEYDDVQGNRVLRQQVARLAFNWGGTVTEKDVVTTHGCMEALVFCLKAVTRPGDLVAIESPTYFGIFNTLHLLGLRTVVIPTDPETGIRLDALEKALGAFPIKACLFVPSFSNPCGYCMPDAHKEGLVRLLAAHNVPLIEDDTYGEMYFGKARPRTCKSFDRAGLVLYCASVTKSLAPGYRVGWCIPGKFLEPVMQLKLTSSVSSTTPTHAAIGHFIATSRYDLHMRHLRKTLHLQSLQYLRAVLEAFPDDTQVAPPQGGYNLWLRLNPAINAYLLFKEALRHRISIAPGHLFSPDGQFSHYVRISFVPPFTPQIEESIKTLGRLAHGLLAAQPASLPAF